MPSRTISSTIAVWTVIVWWMPTQAVGADWQTYLDPEFGTSIRYPADILTHRMSVESGTVFSGSGASLEVSAAREGIQNLDELRDLINEAPGYENVTYSPQGQRWLVVSGYRENEIFYEKFFLVGDTVQGFRFEYPAVDRDFFDPLVELLEDSFRPGR